MNIVHCIRNIKDADDESWGELLNAQSGKSYRHRHDRLIVLKNGIFPFNPESKPDDSFSGTWFFPEWMGERFPAMKDLVEEGVDTYGVTRVEMQTEMWDSLPPSTQQDISELVDKIYLVDRLFEPHEQAQYTTWMQKSTRKHNKKRKKRKRTKQETVPLYIKRKKPGRGNDAEETQTQCVREETDESERLDGRRS